ncbi:GIY-YIG nuclease family protein (plasmid) [Phormidium sp. CLA17]|uniref:ribbon-helix-helix protein, CopG family n=1 Tax=Leptolyngbya sp. Cla-17 TaxID=2803751 RepID=UPI001490B12F|nr:GIY-YIG nuclease family protein [Leptolyngbya sp. Cla-17]
MGTLNLRLPESELELLQEFCEMTERNQTDVIRSYIRSLEEKINPKRIKPATITPYLLPSVPLSKWQMVQQVSCVYFVMDDEEVIYIGNAQNLYERMTGNHHKRASLLQENPSARIHWIERIKSSRVDFEKKCIARFKPKYNVSPSS